MFGSFINCGGQTAYQRELNDALARADKNDGTLATVFGSREILEKNVWKTPDQQDDGSPGVAPIVRARLQRGTTVLVIDQVLPPHNVLMYKITDGTMVGWISENQLLFP